ncbi:MAG: hypothetical protein ACRD5I_14930 [Candidatus Acidiferrales bacterium]
MGVFQVKLTVSNFTDAARQQEVELWVDTGPAYSWISRARLEALGARPIRKMQFRTIEGHLVERDMAPVFVRVDGYSGADNVVMAEPNDMEVMGAFTIEGLGLAVDPVQKKLVPTVGLALTARVLEGKE